jgi:peptidoglycan/xylan/chitin deacetylase (PgdA/CDA1 family)
MSLQELSAALMNASLPRRAVVVTFDDGYADNLLNAKPLLEKFDLPATVFITTGYVGRNREFWWDELERIFLRPGHLPSTLSLDVNGKHSQRELGETADYSSDSHRRNLHWRAWDQEDPSPRHGLYRSLWQSMHVMPEHERSQLRNELLAWAAAPEAARPTHRALSENEIVELMRGGLIDIGCHTITHPRLSALSTDTQLEEISGSKAGLEQIVGRPVSAFAYPYGRESDYTPHTEKLVRDAGFDCGCATTVGVVGTHSERFQLPRVQVEDMNGESFDRFLSESLRD